MFDVTTIMPVWETSPYLIERAVRSACFQVGFCYPSQYKHELIIVDDASVNDDTVDYLNTLSRLHYWHGTKISVIRSGRRLGVGGARNLALKAALGRYVALLDADDNWYSTSLLARLDVLERNGSDFVYGMFVERVLHLNGTEIQQRPPRGRDLFDLKLTRPLTQDEMAERILDHNIMAVFTTLCRRDKMLKVGGFEEGVICSEDWLCWRRLFQLPGFTVEFIDEPLGNYNVYYPKGVMNNHIRLDPNFDGSFHLDTNHAKGKAGEYLDARAVGRAFEWGKLIEAAEQRWKSQDA